MFFLLSGHILLRVLYCTGPLSMSMIGCFILQVPWACLWLAVPYYRNPEHVCDWLLHITGTLGMSVIGCYICYITGTLSMSVIGCYILQEPWAFLWLAVTYDRNPEHFCDGLLHITGTLSMYVIGSWLPWHLAAASCTPVPVLLGIPLFFISICKNVEQLKYSTVHTLCHTLKNFRNLL